MDVIPKSYEFKQLWYFEHVFDCHCSCYLPKDSSKKTNDDIVALKEWAEQKLMKHIGFIIETMIEGKL